MAFCNTFFTSIKLPFGFKIVVLSILQCLIQTDIQRILGECLLISSLPDRLWERLLRSRGVLKAEPGKLDIKKRKPGILFISLPIVERDYDVSFFIFVLIQCH